MFQTSHQRVVRRGTHPADETERYFNQCSRGTVVDIDAAGLNKALLGSAIDVFPIEPKSIATNSPWFNNAILTPHIGGSTQEAQENLGGS